MSGLEASPQPASFPGLGLVPRRVTARASPPSTLGRWPAGCLVALGDDL